VEMISSHPLNLTLCTMDFTHVEGAIAFSRGTLPPYPRSKGVPANGLLL
jgi:hypothetical protein